MRIALLVCAVVCIALGVAVFVFRTSIDGANERWAKKLPYQRSGVAGEAHADERRLRFAAAGAILVACGIVLVVLAIVR